MHVVIVLTVIFLVGLHLFLEAQSRPSGPTGDELAKELLMDAVSLGENASSYSYSYIEYSDGFPDEFTLTSDGKTSSVEVIGPLSKKKAYFLENDTILCITFQGNESCSSVKNESVTSGYMSSLKSRLFSKGKIEKARSDLKYRTEHNMQVFSPSLKKKVYQIGDECIEISYIIDYANATLSEMQRFNVLPGSPTHFEAAACIGNQTGELYESQFNYTFMDKLHTSQFKLKDSDFDSKVSIIAPANLTGNAVETLIVENSYKNQLVQCFQKTGSEQNKCIALMALQLKSKNLCSYAGSRKDRCLVSIVPLTKDTAICPQVQNDNFKDDCYIELAGAYKNSTWCNKVLDPTKNQYCLSIVNKTTSAPPKATQNASTTSNTTSNTSENQETELPEHIKKIFEKLENNTNQSSNSSG